MQCFFIAYVARSSPFGGHNGITGNTVLYSNLKFTNKQKDMKHTFSCMKCRSQYFLQMRPLGHPLWNAKTLIPSPITLNMRKIAKIA